MENKKSLQKFEKSTLLLLALFMIELFLVFLHLYLKQTFPVEQFVLIIIQILSVLLSYFLGILLASIFSIVYVVGSIVYVINSGIHLDYISYALFLFVPITLLFAGSMRKYRQGITRDLERLEKLEGSELKIDPNTLLENQVAFKEILSKQAHLAKRYDTYTFSVSMIRLEFIDTLRTILDVKDFNHLLEEIAKIIQTSIRIEDYKFIIDNNRFAIITPLTEKENVKPAIRRILEKIEQLVILDRNSQKVDVVLKYSTIEYSREENDLFEDEKDLILELQKATEVDIHGEYFN